MLPIVVLICLLAVKIAVIKVIGKEICVKTSIFVNVWSQINEY